MLKRLKNKKGLIYAGTVVAIWYGIAVLNVVYCLLPSTRTSFQAKKAQILCEEGYRGVSCSEVDQMNKAEILAYIKDDIEVPQYVMSERLGG